ncbi:MAG: peptidoglycan-binding protein [Methylocystis sp.]|nr:peptidoglycan-binding protein [Methylocystis sp.]
MRKLSTHGPLILAERTGENETMIVWALLSYARRRPAVAIFFGLAAATAIGIPLNALYFQDGRHPAPLFREAGAGRGGASQPHAVAKRSPLPPPRPVFVAPTPLVEAKPAVAKAESGRASAKPPDPIGRLLDGEAPTGDSRDKGVLAAQRALLKLGYALRADGVLGGATRQAIEKFERDIGLPAKGDLTPALIRQLAARLGAAVE